MADTELGAAIIKVGVDGTEAIAGSDKIAKALDKVAAAQLRLEKAQLSQEKAQQRANKALSKSAEDQEKAAESLANATNRVKKAELDLAESTQKLGNARASAALNTAKKVDQAAKSEEASIKALQRSYERSIAAIRSLQEGSGEAGRLRILGDLRGQKLGIAELEKELMKWEGTAKRGGQTARELAFATRSLPAQFTDIAVSLQGGQAPLTVFLQQGGQLKDMFGGVGNAAQAMGRYVAGLVNPLTIAGTAIIAMGVAYKQGSDEADAFRKAILLTGNAAGVTTQQLAQLARNVSDTSGATVGATAEALAALASTGQVSANNLEMAAEAAVRLNKTLGIEIADTVKQFAELGKAPAEASAKLNEQYNYLTASVYEQIKALELQGDKQGAATLAIETYAKALKGAADEVTANLGSIEKGWKAIIGTAKQAWDAMLNIGRPETIKDVEERIRKLQQQLQDVINSPQFGGTDAETKQLRIAIALAELDRDKLKSAEGLAKAKGEVNKREQASIDLSKMVEEGLDRQGKKTKEILEVKNKFLATKQSDADVQNYLKALSQIEEKYKETAKSAKKAKDEFAELMNKINAKDIGVDAGFAKEVDVLVKAFESGRKGVETVEKFEEALKALAGQQKINVDLVREQEKAQADWEKEVNKSEQAAQKSIDTLQDQAEKLKDELDNYGKLKSEIESVTIARLEEQYAMVSGFDSQEELANRLKAEIELRKQIRDTRQGIEAKDAEKEAAKEAERALKEQAKAWDKFADDIEKSLTDALMRSFEAGDSFGEAFAKNLQNTFKTMALKFAIQAVVDPVSGAVRSAMGIPGSSSAASGGVSGVSNLFSGFSSTPAHDAWLKTVNSDIGKNWLTSPSPMDGSPVMTEFGSTVGEFAQAVDSYGGYVNAAFQASQGNWGSAVGAAVGQYIGGPIGSFIGSELGSLLDGGNEATPAMGIRGFKRGTNAKYDAAASRGQANFSESQFGILRAAAQHMGDKDAMEVASEINEKFLKPLVQLDNLIAAQLDKSKIGEIQDALDNFTTGETEDGSNFQAKLTERLATISNTIGGTVDQIFDAFDASMKDGYALLVTALAIEGQKAFEQLLLDLAGTGTDAAQAVKLTEGLRAVNDSLTTLGQPLLDVGIAGAKAAEGLIAAYGGIENFTQANQTYFELFFSEQEKLDVATGKLRDKFSELGLVMPNTNEGFRTLVESLDLTTEKGQKTDAALKAIAPSFDAVTKATQSMADAAQKASKDIAAAALNIANRTANIAKQFQTAVGREEAAGIVSKAGGGSVSSLLGMTPEQLNAVGLQLLGGFTDTTRDFAIPDISDVTNAFVRAFVGGGGKTGTSEFFLALSAKFDEVFKGIIKPDDITRLAYDTNNLFIDEIKGENYNTVEQAAIDARTALLDSLDPVISALEILKTPVEEVAADVADTVTQQQQITQDTSAFDAEANRQASIKLQLERQLLEIAGDTQAIRALELAGLDDTNKELQKRIWALQDEAEATRVANENIDKALAGVRRAVDAEIEKVQAASDAMIIGLEDQIEALQTTKNAAQETAQSMGAMFDSIESGIKSLRGTIDPEMDRTQARAYIDMALSLAQAGGVPDRDKLSEAITKITQDSEDAYATRLDFIRAQSQQAGKLDQLGLLVGKQKTVAEQQLESIENQEKLLRDQIEQGQKNTEEVVRGLNAQYIKAEEQVNVLMGIDTSIKSIPEAIKALAAAIQNQANIKAAADTAAMAAASAAASAQASANFAASGGISGYGVSTPIKLSNGDFYQSGSKIQASQITSSKTMRSYDAGTDYVPSDMLANIHKGEIIVDPKSADILRKYGIGMNIGGDPQLKEEIALLRQELKVALGAVASNTRQTKDLLDSTINGGNTIRTEAVV